MNGMKVVRKVALPVIFTAALASGAFANKPKAVAQARNEFSKQSVLVENIKGSFPLILISIGLGAAIGLAIYNKHSTRKNEFRKAMDQIRTRESQNTATVYEFPR
ncbi:MAG: hypothetical protein WC861_05130 [Candidatus Micrarchaeia archaeon]